MNVDVHRRVSDSVRTSDEVFPQRHLFGLVGSNNQIQ